MIASFPFDAPVQNPSITCEIEEPDNIQMSNFEQTSRGRFQGLSHSFQYY